MKSISDNAVLVKNLAVCGDVRVPGALRSVSQALCSAVLIRSFLLSCEPEPEAIDVDAKEERQVRTILEAEAYLERFGQCSKARNLLSDATCLLDRFGCPRCESKMHRTIRSHPRPSISSLVL